MCGSCAPACTGGFRAEKHRLGSAACCVAVDTMFRIGEFSKLTQVSIRMLRYYDEVGLLKPARVDKLTGYRLYSIDQIQVIQQIILLRDMEFNVAEIAYALVNWDDSFIIGRLENKKKEIQGLIPQASTGCQPRMCRTGAATGRKAWRNRPRSMGPMNFAGAGVRSERTPYRPSKTTKSGSNIKFSSFVTQR